MEKPLYDYVSDGRVRVLLIGEVENSLSLAGTVLELSQTGEFYPFVTLVSPNPLQCDFLDELSDYICIDGKAARKQDLGTLNVMLSSDFYSENGCDEKFDYIFLAFNFYFKNLLLADLITEWGFLSEKSIVNTLYASVSDYDGRINAVAKDYIIENHPDYDFFVRCAKNTHMLWVSSMADMESTNRQFEIAFNRKSSISNVVSLKYKLHPYGMAFSEEDAEETARLLKEKMESHDNGDAFIRDMAAYEHKRWIINIIFEGWRCLENVSELPDGEKKNSKKKLNCCIRPGNSDFVLQSAEWEPSGGKWESASADELDRLDSLDRMSVDMHRHFMEKAKKIKKSEINSLFSKIRTLLYEKKDKRKADFSELYKTSIDGLFENLEKFSKERFNAFLFYNKQMKGELSGEEYQEEKELLNRIDGILFPLVSFCEYNDWKGIDLKMLKNLPFILTNNNDVHICKRFTSGENDSAVFKNAAVCLMLNPKEITYMLVDSNFRRGDLLNEIDYVCRILDSHLMQTEINIAVFSDDADIDLSGLKSIHRRIKSLNCYDRGMEAVKKFLETNKTEFDFYETDASTDIPGADELMIQLFYPNIRIISFDMLSMKFDGCQYLNYIPDFLNPKLNLSDILLVKDIKISRYSEPVLQTQYKKLWEMFNSNSGCSGDDARAVWKELCTRCQKETRTIDRLASNGMKNFKGDTVSISFELPKYVWNSTEKIFLLLKSKKAEAWESWSADKSFENYFRLNIRCVSSMVKFYKTVFGEKLGSITEPSLIRATVEKGTLSLYGGALDCTVNLSPENLKRNCGLRNELKNKPQQLLAELEKEKFISDLDMSDIKNITFKCASEGIKELLTNEGKIFENYVYYSVLEQGVFDEVYSGIEIYWNETVCNEIDVLIIKNLTMAIVECKCRKDNELVFYDKLNALGGLLGINYKMFLVQYFGDEVSEYAEEQMTRGSFYKKKIETVSKKEDIDNIGNVLFDKL